jgi:hypothetical protein
MICFKKRGEKKFFSISKKNHFSSEIIIRGTNREKGGRIDM